MERTLAIIKPDATERNLVGKIVDEILLGGFEILDMKLVTMSKKHAEEFYAEHEGKPFFERLTNFMSSGPSVFLVLEKKNAIKDWRTLMGPTNIEEAKKERFCLRGHFGLLDRPLHENIVHGSDSPESAGRELNLFYDDLFYYRSD